MDHDYSTRMMPRKPRPTQRGYGGPIVVLLVAVLLFIGLTVSAFAQTSESTSISGAETEVEVRTKAISGSAINNYGQKAGKDNKVYNEVATAPGLGGLALGGGHPCAYSPATAQISIIGGGAGIGGSKVDSACMLMVMGAAGDPKAYKAAQLMLAARDPAACAAMDQAGLVECVTAQERRAGRRNWSTNDEVADTGTNTGTGAKCTLAGKVLTFRPTSAAARVAELAACRARYGV